MMSWQSRFKARFALFPALLLLVVAASALPSLQSEAQQALAFAVIGDTGTGAPPQFEVARQMKTYRNQVRFDFVLMLGDNIYFKGEPKLLGPRFEQPYQELLQDGVKFYAVLGNHDVMTRKGAEAEVSYDKFNMGGQRYYSFVKGDALVEFFALDSNSMTAEQLSWLEDKLQSSKARWKVAFAHHPIYSSARRHGSDLGLRAKLEPRFVRYHVDAVFAGHDHVYERTKLQQGVSYFIEGASGQLRKGNLNRQSPLFEAGNDQVNSFLIVQVDKAEMTVTAISAHGETLDSVVIKKGK